MKGGRRGGGREGKWMEADNDFEASFLPTTATLMPSGINYWKLHMNTNAALCDGGEATRRHLCITTTDDASPVPGSYISQGETGNSVRDAHPQKTHL